jgi:hypothetical protein
MESLDDPHHARRALTPEQPPAGRSRLRRSVLAASPQQADRGGSAQGDSDLRHGDRRRCTCEGWPGTPVQARVRLPWSDLDGRTWLLTDRLSGERFERAGDELARAGLLVALKPRELRFLAFGS